MPIDVYPPVAGGGGGGGIAASAAGNSISSGTVVFSNSNNVSFGMAGSTITATATFAGGGGVALSAAGSSQSSGTLVFSNSNNVSFGMNGSTVTGSASYSQSVQTQASGNIGATGFATTTTNGTVILGTNNTAGFTLAVPPYITTYVGQTVQPVAASGSNGSFAFSTITFGNLNGLSHYTSNGSLVASYTVPSAQTGLSGIQVSNTTYTSGTVTFQNANGLSFGSSGANGISGSYTVPSVTQFFSNTGTTFNGANISGSLTLNTNGLQVSLSGGAGGGGVAIAASNTTFTSGTVVLSAAGGAITISSGAQSALFSVPATSSLAATGNASLSTNGSTISIGANAAAVSIGGNSTSAGAGYSNISSGTVVFLGGNNITLSQNGASITISGPNAGGAQTGISGVQISNTTYTSGTITFQNANGISFGSSGANGISASYTVPSVTQYFSNTSTTFNGANISGSITLNTAGLQLSLSAGAGGGQTTGGVYLQGNTSNASSTTMALSSYNLSGLGAITLAASASSIQIQVPATSSLVGTNGISLSTNGSTISVSYLGDLISAGTTSSNLTNFVFSNSNNVSFGLAGSTITASVLGQFTGSWWQPENYGNTVALTMPNGTIFMRPFELDGYYDVNKIDLYHSFNSSRSTASFSASVSAGAASSGSGSWGLTGTYLILSRSQTNPTQASWNSIVTKFSNTHSMSAGYSASLSWSTNVSSATASLTTAYSMGFVGSIDTNGNVTYTNSGATGSTTFSSTSTNANSFSTSYIMTQVYAGFSGQRAIYIPAGTVLGSLSSPISAGEYWFALIQSTNTGSTNMPSLMSVASMSDAGRLFFTASTNPYMEIGNSVSFSNSGVRPIFGSYGTSANTTTAIALSQFTAISSHASLWFALDGRTK